jgi:hypothetical protein
MDEIDFPDVDASIEVIILAADDAAVIFDVIEVSVAVGNSGEFVAVGGGSVVVGVAVIAIASVAPFANAFVSIIDDIESGLNEQDGSEGGLDTLFPSLLIIEAPDITFDAITLSLQSMSSLPSRN